MNFKALPFLLLGIMAVFILNMPTELKRETLNISSDGETLLYYQLPSGECSRTQTVLTDVLRGLNETKIEVHCLKVESLARQ